MAVRIARRAVLGLCVVVLTATGGFGADPSGPFGLMLNVPGADPNDWQGFVDSLDAASGMGASSVRLTLIWRWLEPEDDRFVLSGGSADRITAAEERGLAVVPVIKCGRGWASGYTPAERGDLSVPPVDLTDTWNPEHGYSASYYDFVYRVVSNWRGRFPYVVIENEANAENFWAGTPLEYLRLLVTAYKAVHEADPSAKVANSGIASGAWGLCIAADYLENGEWTENEALTFLRSYYRRMPASYLEERLASVEAMRAYLATSNVVELYEDVTTLLAGYAEKVDVINLHYYEDYWHLHDVIDWIDRRTAMAGYHVPIKICNEYGIRNNDADYSVLDSDQAAEVFKKLTIGLAERLEHIVWFSGSERDSDKTSLVGAGISWREAAFAFRTVAETIGSDFVFDHTDSRRPSSWQLAFRDRQSGVPSLVAAWSDEGEVDAFLEAPVGLVQATRVDHLGQERRLGVSADGVTIRLSPLPLFIRWSVRD